MKIKTIVTREIRLMFVKEPIIAFLLLGVGAAYTLLMGLLYANNLVNYVPMVVYDQDQTKLSRTLIQAFDDSERFRIVADVLSQEDMELLLRNKTAYCALSIPANYARDVKNGVGSHLLFALNGSSLVFDSAVISTGQEILSAYLGQLKAGLLEAAGQMPGQALGEAMPIRLRLRVLNNPTLNYTGFFVLGVLFTAFQSGVMMAVSMSMAGEYARLETLKKLSAVKFLFAKLLPYWIGGLGGFIAAVLIAVDLFGVPFRGSPVNLIALGGVFIFMITSLASLLPAFCRDRLFLIQLIVSYAVPCFLFSGYTWPQHAMNTFSRIVSATMPVTYIADNVRDLALNGYAPGLHSGIVILLFAGLSLFGLSATCLRASSNKNSI